MFWYISIIVFVYVLIVRRNVNSKSTPLVLMIYEDGKSVGDVALPAKIFSEAMRIDRAERGCSLLDIANLLEMSVIDLFLLEHGLKISPEAFLHFMMVTEEVEEVEGRYVLIENSPLMEWCRKSCKGYAISQLSDEEKNVDVEPQISLPEVFPTQSVSFDEYVFKGTPMVLIRTEILSLEAQDVPVENVVNQN
jgi:hypothetical protein